MQAQDMQPASLVENQGFRSFVTILDPQYDIPSRRTVMRRLPAKYNETKQRMLEVLAQLQYLSLTTDFWTSQATDSYLRLWYRMGNHSKF